MAASLGSLQVVVAADMLTRDVDVGDGGLAGQLAQRVLDVRAVIHLVQLEQQGLVLRQVHLLEERLLGALAVGAVRLGGDEDGLGLDEGLDTGDSLSRDHCAGREVWVGGDIPWREDGRRQKGGALIYGGESGVSAEAAARITNAACHVRERVCTVYYTTL